MEAEENAGCGSKARISRKKTIKESAVWSLRIHDINRTERKQNAVFYFQSEKFIKTDEHAQAYPIDNGFAFYQPSAGDCSCEQLWFHAFTDEKAYIDTEWFRGSWFDSVTMLCNRMIKGEYRERSCEDASQSRGATLSIPVSIEPRGQGEGGACGCAPSYKPWYSGQYKFIDELDKYIFLNVKSLRQEAEAFSDCFFSSTLPAEVLEAVSVNLSILKSPTVLRQTDGRLWGWEGCYDDSGCCAGSCTHVWNYAMSIPNLFPGLERGLRDTEFTYCQDEIGHQQFRAPLPIGEASHNFHAAADGQLGGIIKLYRDCLACTNITIKRIYQAI